MTEHPLSEHLSEFRTLMEEARQDAARAATPALRERHAAIAQNWERLIAAIEGQVH